MSDLDHLLDDALAGFDDDEQTAHSGVSDRAQTQLPATSSSSADPATSFSSAPLTAVVGASNVNSAAAVTPANLDKSPSQLSSSMQFDPLKRSKGKKGGSAAGISNLTSSKKATGNSDVDRLQADLNQLMAEWEQAMRPQAGTETDTPTANTQAQQPMQQQQRGNMPNILQALQEQTQRTVEQQARARPVPAGAPAPGDDNQQMNMIVDVVMQHLLSKDVLYQPMKEIADKYPPWLEQQTMAAAAGNSRLSAADLERYRQQYDCITRLCTAYETEPAHTAKIMALLQEMQACGEPPEEIVADMTNTIAADLPGLSAGGAVGGLSGLADLNFDDLDLGGLGDVPDLKNCPMQ